MTITVAVVLCVCKSHCEHRFVTKLFTRRFRTCHCNQMVLAETELCHIEFRSGVKGRGTGYAERDTIECKGNTLYIRPRVRFHR